ncbi:MAG: M15 family metallopeptidase [Clostridia bacterium]|nr:M15 family metallopeptidase [Clostridia bacterium]
MANQTGDRGFNTVRNSSVAKRERNRAMQKYTILGVIALATLAVAVLLVMAVGGIIANIREASGKAPSSEKVDWASITVTATDTLHGPLVLVNNTHVYTFPANTEHLGSLNDKRISHSPRIYQQSGLSDYMEKDALNALDQMLVDFHAATGLDDIMLKYAYRSAEDQQELVDKGASTRVGYSDHHTGLGIQLGYARDDRNYALSTDPVYNWLFDNCHKYGFVIRYPENKSDVTGVSDYTDYFRYVGVAHATYMEANDLCLEEYVERLKGYTAEKPLKINGADGRYYETWYVAVDGSATVKHPTNYAYTISGTNDGGVVVTVDRTKTTEPGTEAPEDTTAVTPVG